MTASASSETSFNIISIGRPVLDGCRYSIPFSVPEKLKPFFRSDEFWFECPDAGDVPESIAVYPPLQTYCLSPGYLTVSFASTRLTRRSMKPCQILSTVTTTWPAT